MKKILLTISAAALVLAGCANVPPGSENINLITMDEAQANNCEQLGWVGSASGILINGKARNTAQILRRALKVPGATHIAYTKGKSGWATARAAVFKCPDPNLKTKDPDTIQYSIDYLKHY